MLFDLSKQYELDQDHITTFQANGHVLLPGVLNAREIAAYRPVINDAAYRYNTERRKMADRDTYGKAFLQIMNLWKRDPGVAQFTLAKRFARIAAGLLGVKNVRLYHDQALYKEAGGGITPWHQDQFYWPVDTPLTVTMWMPLIDIAEDMGMLTFASRSHKDGPVGSLAISDESESTLSSYISGKGYPISRPAQMKAGDASWHYGWTLHSAPGNNSPDTREVMTIIYVADGARVTKPANDFQENDRQTWLSGREPGSHIDSPLNPALLS
ncbi:MAG TPA: phytanoyl-CoA dioxygenase family protein [Puia sp.]|nr:phytanoyl-CoA dioxygenase family protein [Puia sp.]